MPPRARYGKWAGTRFEKPSAAQLPKPIPGVIEKWEREYEKPILKHCKEIGLSLIFHDPNSKDIAEKARGIGTGFPDWWFLGPRGLLVREKKRDSDGRVSDKQAEWIEALCHVGIDADIWWMPRDLNSGRVYNELNAIARTGPHADGDLVNETGKLMYLATVIPADIPAAAMHWDAGTKHVNRSLWRKEARLLMHRAALTLPIGEAEITAFLRAHQLRADATPAQVLAAVRAHLTRHEEEKDAPQALV